jgi:signal transduction histidine kinase
MRALHLRLTGVLAVLLVALALGIFVLLGRTSDRYADELRQRLDAGIAMYVVRELPLMHGGTINEAALRELARRAMTVNPSAEVYLIDPNGSVISTVVRHEQMQLRSVRLGPILEFLRAPEARPLYGDDPTSLRRQRVFSVAPIVDRGRLYGYLYVVLGGQPERSIAARLRGSYTLRAASLALGLVLLAVLFAGAGFFFVLTRRLRNLDRSLCAWSKTLPEGKGFPAAPRGGDEISALDARFGAMSGAIERQIRELKATDDLRRELIANVSHDLRTPLASLRGYIETLLVKRSASLQERESHLNVALRQADQLGRLIDALFELAKLESGTVAPRLEEFAIAELLQDIAQRFRMRAEKRGVELHTFLDVGSVTVLADLELVERALGNLLENAIRYTPRGGQVRIEMSSEESIVRIRVVDTGQGIDAAHLPRIFDRFYSARAPGDRNHMGLGLAIVKRIADLHAQHVAILSQKGAGTTVEITLQRLPGAIVTPCVKSA